MVPSSSNDVEITVPSVFGFGATSQLSPKLLIAAEYQNRKYSDIEMNNLSISGIDDGSCYRFGAEYREGQTLLRYGYFSDAVYASDANDDDEPLSLTGFTGGIGHNLGEVYVDAFIEYSSLTVEYEDIEIGTYDVTTNMFRFGLSASSKF